MIATKIDRLSGNERTVALKRLSADFQVDRVLPYSAKTGAGRDDLWRAIWDAAAIVVPQSA